MKKCLFLLGCILCLTGCGASPTLETVSDEIMQPVSNTVYYPVVNLPEEAAAAAMEGEDGGTIWLCDGYSITLQTLPGGDLDRTLRAATGFGQDGLCLLETWEGDIRRIQTVWVAAGETGEQVGRLTLLDDGENHHVLTCMADDLTAGAQKEQWQELMDTFYLTDQPQMLHTGS